MGVISIDSEHELYTVQIEVCKKNQNHFVKTNTQRTGIKNQKKELIQYKTGVCA